MIVTHKTYGRVVVDPKELATSDPFIWASLLNPRDNLENPVWVGKSALSDSGGYVRKNRPKTLVEKYLPLAYSGAAKSYRKGDDFDELLSVACLALCEVTERFDGSRNNGFAAYAKPRIEGALLDHKNPERNGTMNIVGDADTFMYYIGDGRDAEKDLMVSRMYEAFELLTPKQRYVMRGLYVYGRTMQDIADSMGVVKSAVHKTAEAATVAIRKHLNLDDTKN